MDVDGRTYEPSPQRAESPQWPTTAACSPSMCPTCGDMPLLWAMKPAGGRDKSASCPICHMRIRPTPL